MRKENTVIEATHTGHTEHHFSQQAAKQHLKPQQFLKFRVLSCKSGARTSTTGGKMPLSNLLRKESTTLCASKPTKPWDGFLVLIA